jgi:hypothetical protein
MTICIFQMLECIYIIVCVSFYIVFLLKLFVFVLQVILRVPSAHPLWDIMNDLSRTL